MKFGWQHYFRPTPKRIRILGDSMAAASVFVSGMAISQGYEKLALYVSIAGWAGKFLSNFFTDAIEDDNKSE
jgi:hypothetical protein